MLACHAVMYIAFGICAAAIVGFGIVLAMYIYPDEDTLRKQARARRLRHPRT